MHSLFLPAFTHFSLVVGFLLPVISPSSNSGLRVSLDSLFVVVVEFQLSSH